MATLLVAAGKAIVTNRLRAGGRCWVSPCQMISVKRTRV